MLSLLSFLNATSSISPSQFSVASSPPLSSSSSFHQASSIIISATSSTRHKMSSDSLPPLPENRILVGCGGVVVDFLAAVAAYPKPDDKIRSTSLKVQGGGNAGNALTCAARLGLHSRVISKISDDAQGRIILEELEADGVDTSFLVVSKEGNSPFTYVIVDNETKTRTCIHTPGYPPMTPDELSKSSLFSALDGARIVYSDVRLHETALVVVQEAARRNIPILVDAEKKREGLDDLLEYANYVVCSAKFPQVWTEATSVPSALVSMLLRLPNLKFVIVTLGEDGCIMLERSANGEACSFFLKNLFRNPIINLPRITPKRGRSGGPYHMHYTEIPQLEEVDVDSLLVSLKQRNVDSISIPTCVSSGVTKLRANGIGTVSGRLFVGTAEKIPPAEVVDTTGAGDAFIGAIMYAICADMTPEKMLPFASQVAAANCRALGARSGLPHRGDSRLTSLL